MKMFMKGLVIAAVAALAPLPAQADTTEINFGIISTESQQEPEAELVTVHRRHGQADRHQDQSVLRV